MTTTTSRKGMTKIMTTTKRTIRKKL
jgi:hypothetical protein